MLKDTHYFILNRVPKITLHPTRLDKRLGRAGYVLFVLLWNKHYIQMD